MSSPPAVHILGVNQLGHESANDLVCQGRDLPWLQETLDDQVWNKWKVTYRDVVVLDRNNRPAAVFNLTVHDLAGRRVATLVDGEREAGRHAVDWRPRELASGTYLYRLQTADGVRTGRAALVR